MIFMAIISLRDIMYEICIIKSMKYKHLSYEIFILRNKVSEEKSFMMPRNT